MREADGEEQLDPAYGPNYTDTAVTDMAHLLQSGGSSMDVLRVELDLPSPSDLQKGPQKKGRGKKKDQPAAVPAAGLAGLASSWYLQKAGIDYVLLEGSDRFGGGQRWTGRGPFTLWSWTQRLYR